jgi:dTDP-4-amino-4,6-dideoxygalactose transaminase
MIPLFKVRMPESVDAPLLETLHSGCLTQGEKVDLFEAALADEVQNRRVLTLNSGTAALQLALRLAGVGHGDIVISTPMTCIATNTPILSCGARVVWADIDPQTGCISPDSVYERAKEYPQAKAIIGVDWAGYPCDLDELHAVAGDFGMSVIEDAAQAFGAVYQGARVGSVSDFTAFSFQAIKHLTTGDGGALACRNEADYQRGKLLRWFGIDRERPVEKGMRHEANVVEWGYKTHMNDLAATIGLEQIKTVGDVLMAHRENAYYYTDEISARGLKHIRPLSYQSDRTSSYWIYTCLVDNRDSFIDHMTDRGITVSRVHARNDKHSCFDWAGNRHALPGLEEFDAHQVNIPCGWWITREDREYIMDAIESWDKGKG